ncbi:MAG TPA: hypothetical protein VGE04_06850 [Chloroflexia bacterium]
MEERDRSAKLSPEIYVYATNKNFLNLYDALRIDKVKVEIAGYDQATNRQTGHASAWLDKDDARLLTHLVCNRLFAPVTGGKWEKYGGSQREDGNIESRTVVLEWDEGEGGRFARFPYRLTISNGPGKKTTSGGVAPAGEPTARLTMRIPELDMIKLMLALGSYVQAYETAHHHRIVANRLNELRDKLAERASHNEARYASPERPAERQVERPAASRPTPEVRTPANPVRESFGTGTARPALRPVTGGSKEPIDLTPRTARNGATRAG